MCIFALMAALSFTSCDEDADLAYDLNGIWEGTIQGEYYYDRFHSSIMTWDTQIMFVQEGDFSRGGYGTEVDYNWETGETTWSDFDWYVRDSRIYLAYDDGYGIVINDYDLYNTTGRPRFRGYFEDWDTGEQLAAFTLIKTDEWADYAKKNMMISDD